MGVPDCSLEHLRRRIRVLLSEQPPAHQVAGMIVDDPDQIDRVDPLEMAGEDIDLSPRVRTRTPEAPGCLRWRPSGWPGRWPGRSSR